MYTFSTSSSLYARVPLHLSHTHPRRVLALPSLPPIHLVQAHPAHPPAALALVTPVVARALLAFHLAIAAPCAAFGGVGGCRRVNVLPIDVLCLRDERAPTIAALGVALFEAEDLEPLLEEVDEVDHDGKYVWYESGML